MNSISTLFGLVAMCLTRHVIEPIIPLQPAMIDIEVAKKKGECATFKLWSNSADAEGAQYKVVVPYFNNEGPYTFLKLLKDYKQVCEGQLVFTASDKYTMFWHLLKGTAYGVFNTEATKLGTETQAHLDTAIKKLKEHVFPHKALVMQKHWM